MTEDNNIQEKVLDRIRKLIRLKESTTSEGEANNAALLVNRLLREYNLSLLDVEGGLAASCPTVRESGSYNYKDSFGSYWRRDLLQVLCRYNYCRILLCRGATLMRIVGTEENITAVGVLYDYLRTAFRRLAETRYREYVSGKRGYYRTGKYRMKFMRSYLEGVSPGLREQYEALRHTHREEERGTALALCHSSLIDGYLERIGAGVSRARERKAGTDCHAYLSGMGDGRSISLSGQLKGGRT